MLEYDNLLPPERVNPNYCFSIKSHYWMNDYEAINYIKNEIDKKLYYISHNGKIISDIDAFFEKHYGDELKRFSIHFRLCGGKGGFGSLLRSFRVNKSTNKLMMRDLNGRRLASVDEEKKLRRYLERQARKDEELREKRKAKLERLTAPAPKHQFEDQDYINKREEIIEKTEDACEAGFAYMKELRKKKDKGTEDDGDESEVEDVNALFNERGGRKRKIDAPTVGDDEKRNKIDYDSSDSEDDSENEPDAEQLEAIREYFKNKEENNGASSSESKDDQINGVQNVEEKNNESRKRLDSASNVDDLPKIDEKTPCDYAPVNLEEFKGVEDLELLGLEHLKSALTERGLKCGGTLTERASRLWSIKDLEPRQYPKNILTPEMKRKIAEEEEAERKANKKKKKRKQKN